MKQYRQHPAPTNEALKITCEKGECWRKCNEAQFGKKSEVRLHKPLNDVKLQVGVELMQDGGRYGWQLVSNKLVVETQQVPRLISTFNKINVSARQADGRRNNFNHKKGNENYCVHFSKHLRAGPPWVQMKDSSWLEYNNATKMRKLEEKTKLSYS